MTAYARPNRPVAKRLPLFFALMYVLAALSASAQPIPSGDIRIHYFRPDGNYSGWTVYAFDNTTENTGNYSSGPVLVAGTDSFGVYFDVGSHIRRARGWDYYSQPNCNGWRSERHSQ